MKEIGIKFLWDHSREISDIDFRGKIVPPEKSTVYGLRIPISFVIDGYDLNSLLHIWITKKILHHERLKESAFAIAVDTFPDYLRRIDCLNVFADPRYEPPLCKNYKLPEQEKFPYLIEFDTQITEKLYSNLRLQKEKDAAAKESFELAAATLHRYARTSTSLGFATDASQIRELLAYIRTCYDRSDYLLKYAWVREKLSCLQDSFEELIRRRIENNAKYQYFLDNVISITLEIEPPFCWWSEPPDSRSIDYIIRE
jgi:hypothetical protein